jgi:anti-sigma regulatory factor (Ser/Thr protein kinase)
LEASHVAEVRRRALAIAADIGLDEARAEETAIVISELGSNLLRHGDGGDILLRRLARNDGAGGIEILALDNGPGMTSIPLCLQDGYSTVGGLGAGLGAVKRLASTFDLHTNPGIGTAVLARMWPKTAHAADRETAPLKIAGVCVPLPGLEACGDAWAAAQTPGRSIIAVMDGLGHGPLAAESARRVIEVFLDDPSQSPAETIRRSHPALHRMRGVAMAIAEVLPQRGEVRYAGIGNISGVILAAGASHSMVSRYGIVGQEIRKIQEFTYDWPTGAVLIMHSDGLMSRWSLEDYPGLAARDPAVIAGVLYRDFSRRRDDVTVVVAAEPRNQDGAG